MGQVVANCDRLLSQAELDESNPFPAWGFRRLGQLPNRLEDLEYCAIVRADLAFERFELPRERLM